jgi:FAD/FMN-containing dehydrogenase
MTKRGNTLKLVAMFVLGSLIASIITLLLAPRSGRQARTQLKNKGLNLANRAKSFRQQTKDKLNLKQISNWGNYPHVRVKLYEFEDIETLQKLLLRLSQVIPRGNGRCYGDSSLAPHVISTLRYNKFMSFDADNGTLRCQSGVILTDILKVIVPRGWFLPVTPGTKLITVGGAIASDVHGKSQHKAGNFSDHVLDMEVMLGDGTIVPCSKETNSDLYWTTCGGMGLTGVVLNATLQLIPIETAYIRQESIKVRHLDHLMDLFEQSEDWTYSVAWIDCLATGDRMGRGILMRGEHAEVSELQTEWQKQQPLTIKPARKLTVPLNFPGFALNASSVKLFNRMIYGRHPDGMVRSIETYDTFFYPLDSVANWNRIYGKRGFTQYQFILPKTQSRAGLTEILNKISERKMGSFLAVLKLELDRIVLAYSGRLYLTKDARMNKQMFMQSYPDVEKFISNVAELNHGAKFRSFQSDRVGITG